MKGNLNHIVFAFQILIVALTGCSPQEKDHTSTSESRSLRATLESAPSLFVNEGIPHQFFEEENLAIEKQREDVTVLSDFPFYTPNQETVLEVSASLRKILTDENNILTFSGEKKCGGFHPDYAVSWATQNSISRALVCFGCQEIIFTSKAQFFRYDLAPSALKELRIILETFASKRPRKASAADSFEIEETISVTVGGEVNHPQKVRLPVGSTLQDALLQAGELTNWASERRINYFHEGRAWQVHHNESSKFTLKHKAFVLAPHRVSIETWRPKEHAVFGKQEISFDDLKIKLSSKIAGDWIDNYWGWQRGLEFRGSKGQSYYTCFIAYPSNILESNSTPPKGEKLILSVTIRAFDDEDFSGLTNEILNEVRSLVSTAD